MQVRVRVATIEKKNFYASDKNTYNVEVMKLI